MILSAFKLMYTTLGTISLYAGVVALSRIFAGRPFERWTTIFLQSALLVSVTGLISDIHTPQSSRLAAMAAVYVAGLAVLAWRRFHLTRTWGLVFALSLVGVLCLEALVAIQNLYDWLDPLDASIHKQLKLLFLTTEALVASSFTAVSTFAMRRYWNKPDYR